MVQTEKDALTDHISITIVGLGLMGGSLALALRDHTEDPDAASLDAASLNVARIVGVSRNPETLAAARAAGAIDAGTTDLAQGVSRADIVILATPVRTILRQLPEVGRHARHGTVVVDLGSTKAAICSAMAGLPEGIQPVGGHPMCGKEVGGFAASDSALYRGKTFGLCPLPRTRPEALERAWALAEAIGARPVVLDPVTHDHAVAAISHLPYAAAVALVNAVRAGSGAGAGTAATDLIWRLAASGFRDTSRLAASEVEMMLDILLTNRAAVLDWLGLYQEHLANLKAALMLGDEAELRDLLAAAQARRAGMTF
jgi:prephenate dehydrogenase